MSFLQKLYMVILNPIFCLTGKINEKVRNFVIYACFVFLTASSLIWLAYRITDWYPSLRYRAVVTAVVLVIVICMSVRAKLHTVRWNRFISIFYFGFNIVMLLSALLHNLGDGYIEMLIISVAVFPCMYFVWNNREDYETLFRLVSLAVVHVFIVYYIITLIYFPFGEALLNGRYIGMTGNPNMLGQLSVTAAACALYLVSQKSRFYGIYMAMIAVIIIIVMETASRTSMLILAGELFVFVIWNLAYIVKADRDKLKGVTRFIAFAVVVITLAVVIPYGQNLIKPAAAPSENNSSIDASVRLETEGKDINTISSGRMTVWKAYIDEINLTGHDGSEQLYISGDYGKTEYAHNTVLEYTYQSGAIAGLLYLLLELYVAGYVIAGLFNRKKYDPWYIFVAGIAIAYGISSLIEVAVIFYKCMPAMFFYIALAPMFKKKGISQETAE